MLLGIRFAPRLGGSWLGLTALALACTCASLGVGCVDINKTQVKTEDNVIARRPKVVASPRFSADVTVRGGILRVVVTPQCSTIEEETVEHVVTNDKTVSNESRVWMTALSIAGAVPLTGGTAMVADSPNVYDSDLNGRLYNETGQDVVIGLGAALIGLGLACVLPPMVNGLRAVGSEETKTTSQRLGGTIQEQTPCKGVAPLPTYSVVARFASGHTVPLGAAIPGDELDVDLRRSLGSTVLGISPIPEKVAIWINEKFATEIPTDDIVGAAKAERDAQDDAAWTASEPAGCERTGACAGVQSYLARFPNGRHAEEARKMLGPKTNTVATPPKDKGAKVDKPNKTDKTGKAIDAAKKAVGATSKKLGDDARKAFEKAQQAADKEGRAACDRECTRVCEKDKSCKDDCMKEVCP